MTKRNPNAWKPSPIDVGMTFGRWTVREQSSSKNGQKHWRCRCECGNEKSINASFLRSGASQSCGCLMRDLAGNRARKHGARKTVEWVAWQAMVQRCTRASHPAYANYGGRGILVCDEWRNDFAAFVEHVGLRPSSDHSLDRIDNDRGYEPGNVRWATRVVQSTNRRSRNRDGAGRFT